MASLLLVVGTALVLEVSVPLACLFLGVTLAILTPERDEFGPAALRSMEPAIFAAFFVVAGIHLDLGQVIPAGIAALVVIVARAVGKLGSGALATAIAGAPRPVRRLLGSALMPQAGISIGLILLIRNDPSFAGVQETILAVGLTAVLVNETIGSLLTHHAIRSSGEAGRDRQRLIDFIREDNIVIDPPITEKEEALAVLVDLLIAAHRLPVSREEVLAAVMAREQELSTCLGHGLAVPHAFIEGIDQICGAMIISRRGLPFETPDDEPVSCMILVVTPLRDRERHLEILAALARAIGVDEAMRSQLYTSRSAAHAYEVLHDHRSEEFNVYLDG